MKYLNIDMSWKGNDPTIFITICLSFICFSIYWFVAKSARIKSKFTRLFDSDQASYRHIIFTKLVGCVVMGFIPMVVCYLAIGYSPADLGLTILPETMLFSLTWIAGLSALVIPLVYYSAKQPKNLVNYPQIRARIWNRKMLFMNALGWFLYLFGYEFLFRGVLLIPLVDTIGVWPAIAINIALYSATHIPKGLNETIGAVPLGIVLCLLTLASGTIWIAFIVHVVMAWTNTFTALKFNPEMEYKKSWKTKLQ